MAKQYPPGPKAVMWGMNLARRFSTDPLVFAEELKAYDSRLVHYRLGPYHGYAPMHPEIVHEIMVKQAKKFHKMTRQKEVLGKFDGNGLVNSDGDFWRRQRKMIQPAFHSKRISGYADTMVKYTRKAVDQWQPGQVLNIGHTMEHITRDIVTKALFDADVSAESRRIGEIIQTLQEMAFREMSALISLPDWMPHKRHEQQAIREIDRIIHRIIAERRAAPDTDRGDLLSMLLQARDDKGQGMTDQEVRDEAVTMFIAGHETTATAMAWMWYLIARHPEVEAKLLAEVDALGGKIPTFEDVPKLKYALQVFKETMRLYPPTWMLPREAAEEVEIGGYTLPKGAYIHIFPFLLHRDERFFDEPLKFDPDRFAPEREAQITPYAYLPFGGGPRVCIGNSFAMMEVQLMMATILQRYRLISAPGQGEPELEPLIVLQPAGGIQMQAVALL